MKTCEFRNKLRGARKAQEVTQKAFRGYLQRYYPTEAAFVERVRFRTKGIRTTVTAKVSSPSPNVKKAIYRSARATGSSMDFLVRMK